MRYLLAALLMLIAGLSITVFRKRWLLWLYDRVKWKKKGSVDVEKFNYFVGWMYLFNFVVFFMMFMLDIFSGFPDRVIVVTGDTIIVVSDFLILIYIIIKTRE